jgi:hypothetical protein
MMMLVRERLRLITSMPLLNGIDLINAHYREIAFGIR